MTMTLIETKTLVSAAASIELTAIPQTFDDLFLLFSGRATSADAAWNDVFVRPNSATTNLSMRSLFGFSSTVGSNNTSDIRLVSVAGGATANTFSSCSMYVPNYKSSNNKSFSIDNSSERNDPTSINQILAGLWANSAAITSLELVAQTNNFAIGTTVSLYGITKGTDGIVTTS